MYYFEVERRLDNGARVQIRVRFSEQYQTFYLSGVHYIEKGKRKGIWVTGTRLTDD